MAYEESLRAVGRVFDEAALRRIIEDAHRAGSYAHGLLGRLSIPPGDLEAALSGRAVPLAPHRESADAERSDILEAIILKLGRPSYLVRDDAVAWETGSEFTADGVDFRGFVKPRIDELAGCFLRVGRVNTVNHPSMDWIGTAWIVESASGPLAITNRHVAQEFAALRGGRAVFRYDPMTMLPRGAVIDFKAEHGSSEVVEADVRSVRFLAGPNQADIAILELHDTGALQVGSTLSAAEAEAGDLIMSVGYPARDSRNAADAQRDIFGEIYNCKRVAPGLVRQSPKKGRVLQHDASTLGGASGSPLISLKTGHVVGLHFSGVYLGQNAAVTVATIHAALAGSLYPAGSTTLDQDSESRRDGEHAAEHFSDRLGYSKEFLGESEGIEPSVQHSLVVPLPTPESSELATLVGTVDEKELRYTHFSVLYHEARRTPRLTAVNIDGARPQKIVRGNDKWYADLRLERHLQLAQSDFPGDFDRGHMVRREDPNWGTRTDAEQADGDTFHYTNAALQHAQLNRNRQRWLGLEDYVLRSAQTHGFRASVFTGPIIADGDPIVDGREDLQVPLAFWKVIVMVAADERSLHVTGYVLGQAEFVQTRAESFQLGDYNLFQVPVSKIAIQTGIDFHGLEGADPMNARGKTEAAFGGVIAIDAFSDILM